MRFQVPSSQIGVGSAIPVPAWISNVGSGTIAKIISGTPGIGYPVPPLLRIQHKMSKTAILLVKHENAKLN